jgi:diaminopimelate epimerase
MADAARWFMDYRNADGSVARCAATASGSSPATSSTTHLEPPGELAIATRDGVKRVRLGMTGDVTVDMGPATVAAEPDLKVTAGGRSWPAVSVDVGNPHAVAFVDDLTDAGELTEAPVIEPAFPEGVNVEFVTDRGERHIAMRVTSAASARRGRAGRAPVRRWLAAARRAGEAGPTSYVVDVRVDG